VLIKNGDSKNFFRLAGISTGIVSLPVCAEFRGGRISGRGRPADVAGGEEQGNNLMWLLDFKLDFFNDAEAKEKGNPVVFFRVARFFLLQHTKTGEIYTKIAIKYTKRPQKQTKWL
jgi:hypothetical protein